MRRLDHTMEPPRIAHPALISAAPAVLPVPGGASLVAPLREADPDAAGGLPPAVEQLVGGALGGVIRMGLLEVRPAARTLMVQGVVADLGGRAFDLLIALLEARGAVVTREALLRQVWPSVTVVESNLKVQLSLLRRALGPERWRIKTISGRGYLLVMDDASGASAPSPAGGERPLVIVVQADSTTQALVVQALSGVVRYVDGTSRLAFLTPAPELRAAAC